MDFERFVFSKSLCLFGWNDVFDMENFGGSLRESCSMTESQPNQKYKKNKVMIMNFTIQPVVARANNIFDTFHFIDLF